MRKNIFKSTVYHLFHGHETKRDDTRFPIFHKHKAYKRYDWFEHIKRNHNWGMPETGNIDLSNTKTYINESLLYVYLNSPKTRLTVCMVNFLRYDVLIRSLENYVSLGVPINMLIWINQVGSMPTNIKNKVHSLCKKFSSYEIMSSDRNMGTGYPRYMMLSKAYYEYHSDYIMTTDDDIIFQNPESLVLGATVLDQDEYKKYGAMGLWCDPRYFVIKKKGNQFIMDQPTEGFHNVDALGAATMTVRREVLDDCNCDPQYVIGLVDWDFSLSMKSKGWNLGLVCDNRYKPINDTSTNNKEYWNGRWDENTINNSKELFNKKWKIKIK